MEPTRALYRNLFASRAYERSLSQGAALGSSKSYVFFVETITKKPKKAAAVPMAPSRSRDRATNSL
jgi:membrane-bound lytic murein transglycosylase